MEPTFWLQRQNPFSGPPPVYQDLSNAPWLVCWKCYVNLPIKLKANSKHISSNLYSPLGLQNKETGTALQMLLTGVRFYVQHRLYNPYNVPPYYGHLLWTFVPFSLVSVQERLYRSLLTVFTCLFWLYRCPSLNIPGFTHSVTEYFLPDVHKMLGGRGMSSMPSPPQSKRFKPNNSSAKVFHPFCFFCTYCSIFLIQCRSIIIKMGVIMFTPNEISAWLFHVSVMKPYNHLK